MEQVTRYAYRCNACWNFDEVAVENGPAGPTGAVCSHCGASVTPVSVNARGGFPDPYVVAWWDEVMHASVWWKSRRVKPEDAAKVLWRIDPHSGSISGPADPDAYRVLLHEFTALDESEPVPRTLADWLDIARKAGWSYDPWMDQWLMAKEDDVEQRQPERPTENGPVPLPSPVIAAAFTGLNEWDCKGWARNLGDPPKWLLKARRTPGRRTPTGSATWDPVRIALELFDKGASLRALDSVFEQKSLQQWRGEWINKSEYLR
ncbi:hypothetical protein [Paraburkholderia sp. GAS334]|uniref:hypothetical protein n=1 Tax=Paraburkholderia sp. GAS334 TaxID=3035131 RepID=UPI003D1FD366